MNKLTFAIIALVALWIFSGCGSEETQQEEKARPVKSITVGGSVEVLEKGYPGVTKESQESDLSFRIGGPIIKLNVVEGARVNKGDLIAQVDPRDYQVVVQSTLARYNQTKAESDRYYRLWKKGSVAKNDYDSRLANLLEAEAALKDARNALKDTKLLAPYTGFLGKKLIELGEEVKPKEAVTSLVDLSVIEVNTTIPEQLAVQIVKFEKFEVNIETYPDVVFTARLKELEKKPTPEGFPLHLFLDHTNNPNDKEQIKVGAGMSCRVKIFMKETDDAVDVITIPITAVFETNSETKPTVWVIQADSTVQKQEVVIGDIVGNDAIQITEGLSNGQQIVIAGVHRLSDGDKVRILK